MNVACKLVENAKNETLVRSRQVQIENTEQARQIDKVEQHTQTFIALITTIFATIFAGNLLEISKRTVVLLEEQKEDLTQVLGRREETLTQMKDEICHVNNLYGPLADIWWNDRNDKILSQRFSEMDHLSWSSE
jgi:hypothetical protein